MLHWAGESHPDKQPLLKMALLQACHRDSQAMDDAAVLLRVVEAAGLDTHERHLISGGQPAEVYEQVLRELAADQAEQPH